MRFGLLIPVMLSGCGTLFSQFKEYCEERVDCLDGNSDDAEACILNIHNDRRVARVYGCEDDYMEYMTCMKEDADCESYGRYDYWTAEGDCEDDYEDYVDCMSDESNNYYLYDDTAASYAVEEVEEEEAEDSLDQSCWFSDVVCIETTHPDPEYWCSREGGSSDYGDCYSGWWGMCDIPGWGEPHEYAATAYYYGMDGEEACTSVGGTYTAG